MLLPSEPFFLRSGDDLVILDQNSARVVINSGNTDYVRHKHPPVTKKVGQGFS